MAEFPQGNDLPAYVTAKFQELRQRLWSPQVKQAVKAAGCDVEDAQRGLRAWADLGADTILVPVKRDNLHAVDYYPIRERTVSALDEQIWQLVRAIGGDIERHLAHRTLANRWDRA
jgi:hypothetical protein